MADPFSSARPNGAEPSNLLGVSSSASPDTTVEFEASSRTDCAAFEVRVQELLDLRESPETDRGIQEHSGRCADCRELLQQFTRLESTLQLALRNKAPHPEQKQKNIRPLHPISQRRRDRAGWAMQAIAVLLLCGAVGNWLASFQPQQSTLLPVASSASASGTRQQRLAADFSGIRPVMHYRSLEQCYELTSELPGVRPLQSSIQVAISWWWNYLNLDGNDTRALPYHERGFGLNPLLDEANRRV